MNAVEIEEAVSALAAAPFDAAEFPYSFLAAFGNKETTIKRLRAGSSNASDVPRGVLQRNNIHMAVCAPGGVGATLAALQQSPKTTAAKAKFVLATDGVDFEAEDLASGEVIVCAYPEFAKHFGFFLPLAGISTVREIAHNPIDIKATGRLNKLYVELLKDNEDWGTDTRRHELNQFMARLVFCFFAESTGIFLPHLFTETIRQMTDPSGGNTHEVISELFRVMDTKREDLKARKFRPWAEQFPYVNGSLFSGKANCPRFSRTARAYLLRAGDLDWKEINPDIFGSMIQSVADDDERGSLGLHYTSVPNILKVLDPLFLDDLRAQLHAAGDNVRKLKNLRRRIASIRVFDPACGSGNFLVIAYIKMREIEHEIVKRLGGKFETHIKLENFYGIEIRSFPVEIAKLSLLIAEFQCNVRFYGEELACLTVLPLHRTGRIQIGNALRMDWFEVCPPAVPAMEEYDLAGPTGRLALDHTSFSDRAAAETYICGNPPYLGGKGQSKDQKQDLVAAFGDDRNIGELDYVSGWFIAAAKYILSCPAVAAFVATNSINQGSQVHQLWSRLFSMGIEIVFAHKSFSWSNNAMFNATVTCNIVGIRNIENGQKRLYEEDIVRTVSIIGPYLQVGNSIIVSQLLEPLSKLPKIVTGNSPYDGGNLLLTKTECDNLVTAYPESKKLIRHLYGSDNYINGEGRFCLWITEDLKPLGYSIPSIRDRISSVKKFRNSGGEVARGLYNVPHRFRYTHVASKSLIIIPRVSSERRNHIPAGLLDKNRIVSDAAQAIYDSELWVLSIVVSNMHIVWVRTIAGKLENRIRYSSALCYNTFPVPPLTENNKLELTSCAEGILLARETHFPATIADLYDPDAMPDDLREAHARNDEALERIYIGRRFRNDTERLEKLFEMYAKMTETKDAKVKAPKKGKANV